MTLPDGYFCDPRDAYCCGFFLPNARVSSFEYPKEPTVKSSEITFYVLAAVYDIRTRLLVHTRLSVAFLTFGWQ